MDIEVLDIKVGIIFSHQIPKADWLRLFNYTCENPFWTLSANALPVKYFDGFDDCVITLGVYKDSGILITLNQEYDNCEDNRLQDSHMYKFLRRLDFSKEFARIFIELRRRGYDQIIIDEG